MSAMVSRELLATPVVEASDVRCRAARHDHAAEELTFAPTLVVPRRGVFIWQIGPQAIVADPNAVLLFHPARPYRVLHPADDGDDCTALRFAPEIVEEALGHKASSPRYWTLDGCAQRALHRAIQMMRRAKDPLAGEEAALSILQLLAPAPERRSERHVTAIEAVRGRIAADLAEHRPLAVLASEVGLSPYHLARRFRERTGSSIHEYRIRLRLLVALDRLREGETDIAGLAVDLGFASHAHFTSAFRAAFGIPPSDARQGTLPAP